MSGYMHVFLQRYSYKSFITVAISIPIVYNDFQTLTISTEDAEVTC